MVHYFIPYMNTSKHIQKKDNICIQIQLHSLVFALLVEHQMAANRLFINVPHLIYCGSYSFDSPHIINFLQTKLGVNFDSEEYEHSIYVVVSNLNSHLLSTQKITVQNFAECEQRHPPAQNFAECEQRYPPVQNFAECEQRHLPAQNFAECERRRMPPLTFSKVLRLHSNPVKFDLVK